MTSHDDDGVTSALTLLIGHVTSSSTSLWPWNWPRQLLRKRLPQRRPDSDTVSTSSYLSQHANSGRSSSSSSVRPSSRSSIFFFLPVTLRHDFQLETYLRQRFAAWFKISKTGQAGRNVRWPRLPPVLSRVHHQGARLINALTLEKKTRRDRQTPDCCFTPSAVDEVNIIMGKTQTHLTVSSFKVVI